MKRHVLLVVVALLLLSAAIGAGVAAFGFAGDANDEAPRLVASAEASPETRTRASDDEAPGGDAVPGDDAVPAPPRALGGDGSGEAHVGILLGTQPLPELLVEHLRLQPGQGLVVDNVLAGSPADAAGLERDDLILALDGRPVTDATAFVETVRAAHPGELLELEVMHEGERRSVELELAPRPDDATAAAAGWKFPQRRALSMAAPGRLPPLFADPQLDALLEELEQQAPADSMLPRGELQGLLDELGAGDGLIVPSDPQALRERAQQMLERAGRLQQELTKPKTL